MPNSTLRVYGLAIAASAAGVAITRFTWPLFAGTPFVPLFGAVAAATQWGSGEAGLAAIALTVLGAKLAFPPGGPPAWDPRTLAVFVLVAVIANRIMAGRNRAEAALRASEATLRQREAELRASSEQARAAEETVRRAQKAEAVARLVAGIAHNFNNLLTVTMGYTDLLLERHEHDEQDRTQIEEIRGATNRGAALTRQLLAFGKRHTAGSARVDLNETVAHLHEVLTRVIREDIQLTIDVASRPAVIRMDPGDLEQVILNLVINARDALSSGGIIGVAVAREQIETGSSRYELSLLPGDYVRLRVRDNGTGMTPEVQSHLFEPFFTTKEVGQGTGMGLAFVHGIMRHAKGFIVVDSAPGRGTTVSLYFPQAPVKVNATATT